VYAGVRAQGSLIPVLIQGVAWSGAVAYLPVLIQGVAWSGAVAYFGNRARQAMILAARLRQGQEERARRAVVGERVRIARELHDVVAHHMSVISVQAGLARYVLHSDPAVACTALDTVLQASTEALDEMRRMLELLRIDQYDAMPGRDTRTQGYDPAPGLDRLPDLLNRVRAGGVPVELTVTGDRRPLPSGLDLCVFRVVQEGLTNVLKQAVPASTTVTLHYGSDHVVARVADDGGRRQPAASGAAPGHGLIGMGERARLYGGTLTAGHRPEGGFEVCLTLPLPPGEESERSPAD
jgi:signal transduction histidine kinase